MLILSTHNLCFEKKLGILFLLLLCGGSFFGVYALMNKAWCQKLLSKIKSIFTPQMLGLVEILNIQIFYFGLMVYTCTLVLHEYFILPLYLCCECSYILLLGRFT